MKSTCNTQYTYDTLHLVLCTHLGVSYVDLLSRFPEFAIDCLHQILRITSLTQSLFKVIHYSQQAEKKKRKKSEFSKFCLNREIQYLS